MKSGLIYKKTLKISATERIDVYLREIEQDEHYPEGLKYAINYRIIEAGIWTVKIRADNKEQRGHHIHIQDKIEKFEFISYEETLKYVVGLRSRLK
ncbi:MAG: hypothetical protein ABIG96_05525 [Candidatus Micrarchaeota archaeon]